MADTVQRLGVEFFGKIDETSITNAINKIKSKFEGIKLTDLAPGLSANLGSLADALGKSTASLSKLGAVAADVGSKVSQEYRSATTSVSGLTSETRKLITLTEQLATTFAKIDFTNMIKPDQMEMFRSKFVAINKQVDLFTAQLAKVAKPEFMGIQQEALAMSGQIDAAIKALSAGGIGANTPAKIQEIIGMLQQLSKMGGSALASGFKAGTDALNSFGVAADMSVQKVSKLNLGLLELRKVKSLLGEQIANVKQQFDGVDKSSVHYGASVAILNEKLIGLMKTEQSVNSILSATEKSMEATVPVIGRLESAFNLINILDKINPPEIHKASEAWKSSAQNLGMYMKELSQLMHIELKDIDPMKGILIKSKAIETQMESLRGLMAKQTTVDDKAQIDALRGSITKLVGEYTDLERVMLTGAIDKTTTALKAFNITIGMSYDQIRKIKPNLSLLEWEKAAELLKNQVAQLYAQYKGLGPITDSNKEKAKLISNEWEKATKTLDAVSQKMRVLHGATADAARGLRMYWEGFAPMLKSQAAWLTGGALLFGIMYKIQDAVKNFVAFEDRLNRIKIVGEGTKKEIAELRHGLLGLAETTGQTTIALAEAAFYLVKYGLSVKQVNDVLPSLARLTAVAGGTIQENAKGVISLLNAYEMAYEDADRLANALTVTLNKSALEMADLSTILSTVASSGAQLNQPVEQILALSAAMSNLGVKPSTIGTSIRQFIGTLAQVEAPTQRFADSILRKVTIALGSNEKAMDALNPAYHSLVDILLLLNKAGITTHDMFKGLNLRAASGTAAMMNAKDSILDLVIAIRSQNVLTAQFAQVTDSAEMSLKNLSNTLEATITKMLGGGTEAGLARFSQVIYGIIKAIGFMFEGIQGVIVRIGILAAGFIYLTKAVGAATVSFTIFNRVITLAPWMKWLAIISMIISGLELLAISWSALSGEQESVAKKSKEEAEKYSNRIKELRSQITLNNQLAEANLAEKKSIELKNAVLEREIELMQKKRIEAQKAEIQELAGPAGRALSDFISRNLEKQGIKEGVGPIQESEVGDRGMMPRQSTMRRTVDYEQIIRDMEADRTGQGQLVINFLKTLDEETIKDQDLQIQELARYYIARERAKVVREPKEDSTEVKAHKRTMADLDAEFKALIAKNNALRETQSIQVEIDTETSKLATVRKDLAYIGVDPKEKMKLEEEEKKIENKLKELGFKKEDSIKKEAIATMEYLGAVEKLGIDQEIITKNLERSVRIEAEISKIKIDQANVENQLLLPNRTKIDELQALEQKRLALGIQLLEKQNELTKEGFAEAERQHGIRTTLIEQAMRSQEQEIDQSIKLSAREKEFQKLYVERMGIIVKMHNTLELLRQAQADAIDISKSEELRKTYQGLAHELSIVDMQMKHVATKQKTFWQAITEYITEAEEAVKSFSYNMGKAFTDQIEASFADFGKAMVYQNADTIKELRGQRDEDLSNIKEKYDEELLALEESLANGKVTYFDYYKQLQDLNDKYHKDVKTSQDQFEKNMKDSLITISSLWEKFWRAMIDAAINMMAQQAVSGIFSSLRGLFGGAGTNATGAGDLGGASSSAIAHTGGYIGDLVKSFHAGGLNSNEVLIKALRSEYVLNPRAVNSVGVNKLDYINKTGQLPGSEINIYNVVDSSTIPTLSPDDVINVINFDIARRGQTYKSLTVHR